MNPVILELSHDVYTKMWRHLIRSRQVNEEAAFGFVHVVEGTAATFRLVDWDAVAPDGFAYHSGYHIELADHERARVIKKAHDLGASLVEFHSHLSSEKPEFSASDLYGFEETVPHFMWRLKSRPYFAIVVAASGFDGLAWTGDPRAAVQLEYLKVEQKLIQATCKTLKRYERTRRK